jgi:hypothetical protein
MTRHCSTGDGWGETCPDCRRVNTRTASRALSLALGVAVSFWAVGKFAWLYGPNNGHDDPLALVSGLVVGYLCWRVSDWVTK